MQQTPIQQIPNFGNMTQERARAMVEQRFAQNPQLAQQVQSIMQNYGGANPRDIAYDMMRQRGIDPAMFGLPRK